MITTRKCKTCLAWTRNAHSHTFHGRCRMVPEAPEKDERDWCLQWQERGDRDPRKVDDGAEAPWSDPGNVLTLETFQEALRLWPTRYGAWCHRCASWERAEGSSSEGVCDNQQSVNGGKQTRCFHGCDSWSFRGPKQDPASLVCPDCHGPIEDIGQEGSLTVWQCRECERVTTSPVGVTQVFYEDSGPEKFLYRNSEEQAEAPRPISSCVYAVQDDGIAKCYLFATREIAHEWLKREEKREYLEGCTIERYTLWHELPPPECSWCVATGDLTSVIWKGEDLLLCKACLAKCTGKAASDE